MNLAEDADFIRRSIRSLNRHFEKSLQKKVEHSGITLPQLRVIKAVVANPGVTVKQLTGKLQMTQSTVSGIVDRLVRNKILSKQTNPDDRRSVLILPSTEVVRFLKTDRMEFVNEAVIEALSRLTAEQRDRVVEGIGTLVDAVNAGSAEGSR